MSEKNKIVGDDGDNDLRGGQQVDIIRGLDGNDALHGLGAADVLEGGLGHDSLYGGAGGDLLNGYGPNFVDDGGGNLLDGGSGNDTLVGRGGDTLLGGAGADYMNLVVTAPVHWDLRGLNHGGSVELGDGTTISSVESGDLFLYGSGSYVQLGGNRFGLNGVGNDTFIGGAGNDAIGDTGAATIMGGGGDDRLGGGAGSQLDGGAGDDVVAAEAGSKLSGGEGADTFTVFRPRSSPSDHAAVITDFDSSDMIKFQFDADQTRAGVNAFHLVDAFDGGGGELVVSYDAGANRTYLSGDVDGDRRADVVVVLKGDHRDFTQFNSAPAEGAAHLHDLLI